MINKILNFFTKTILLTLLDESWNQLATKRFKQVPNSGDLVYVEDVNLYYEVIKVIYYVNDRNGIFLILKPITNNEIK